MGIISSIRLFEGSRTMCDMLSASILGNVEDEVSTVSYGITLEFRRCEIVR